MCTQDYLCKMKTWKNYNLVYQQQVVDTSDNVVGHYFIYIIYIIRSLKQFPQCHWIVLKYEVYNFQNYAQWKSWNLYKLKLATVFFISHDNYTSFLSTCIYVCYNYILLTNKMQD